jgi:glycosyltransferase involved in cell wall biosynthesis
MNSSLSDKYPPKAISIMGIRGLPARHGGFETFTERLAPYLVAAGWNVTVYCQEDEKAPVRESMWNGIRRIHIGVGPDTAVNSIRFDWACISHAVRERPPIVLTLGYNTAAFGLRLRAAGIPNVMNMDGIEWSRDKWGWMARAWLYLNDWAGCLGATHLVADHPEIARHLASRVSARKISTIPYGTTDIADSGAAPLQPYGLAPGRFATLIARPEPENSILEIVQAFSARQRGFELVVLGNFTPDRVPYHARVMSAASKEVRFLGAIYDQPTVRALRKHSALYLHGHRVGGTNPSLLEAMGAGNPVLAHDNRFNRWVVAEGAEYFDSARTCGDALDRLLDDTDARTRLGQAAMDRAFSTFAWVDVLHAYTTLLTDVHSWVHGRPSWPRIRVPQPFEREIH